MMQTYSKIALSVLALFSISQLLIGDPISLGVNVTLGNNFDAPTLWTYDGNPMIAKGPNQILLSPRGGLISADANGVRDQQVFTTTNSFFNSSAVVGVYNTQLRFDTFTNRWFALAASINDDFIVDTPFFFYLAVSDSDTITASTQWQLFSFLQDLVPPAGDAGAGIPETDFDFATFGIDQNALYIGMNLFASGTSTFLSSVAFVIQKSSVLNGGPIVVNAFRELSLISNIISPVGVDNFDQNPQFGYIIGTNSTNNAELVLYRIINPGSTTPTISSPISIPVALTAQPVLCPLKNIFGNLTGILPFSNRLFASHVRNSQLFTISHIGIDQNGLSSGTPDRTGARWTQLDLTGGGVETATTVPIVVAEGTLYDNAASNPNFYYFPAIMTNAAGTMTICGSTSATDVSVNAFASHRNVTDPVDDAALHDSVQLLTNSNLSYSFTTAGLGFPGELWSLYSRTCIDPVDNRTMWTAQLFVSEYDVMGYQVTELKV